MKFSFKLREPKANTPTNIYFTVFFKQEKKSLIYSTDKKIHPNDWDFEHNTPKNKQLTYHTSSYNQSIKNELNKISSFFIEIVATYEKLNQKLTSKNLKDELDEKLNRKFSNSNNFFEVYDEFLNLKKNDFTENGVSTSTYNRYKYFKKNLLDFQEHTKRKISFEAINYTFYNDFLKYCIEIKKQSANTLHRNIGLFKTFLHWSLKNKKMNNNLFLEFKKPKRQPTTEIALNINQVTEIYNFDLSENKRLEKVRDLFLIGCLTGQRFSNYSNFNKKDIVNNSILVPDCKNPEKLLSIPLLKVTKEILEKYDYNLPKISNQKFNSYLKEICTIVGINKKVTHHIARKTFASTVLLYNDVPMEIVSELLGHSNMTITQESYGKVVQKKVSEEMNKLKLKISKNH